MSAYSIVQHQQGCSVEEGINFLRLLSLEVTNSHVNWIPKNSITNYSRIRSLSAEPRTGMHLPLSQRQMHSGLLYFEKSDFTHFSSFCFCLFCFENWGIYAYFLTSKPLKRFGSSSYIEKNSCHKLDTS